jgi:hypothetical protein
LCFKQNIKIGPNKWQKKGWGAMQNNVPLAEKIMSTLIELYADQMGVKIEYTISDSTPAPDVQEVALCG